jgi:parallel beta-helix repeat protein
MRFLCRLLAVAALAALPFVLAPAASATSGTLVITSNTTLTEDHFGSIVIDADNVTLDGAGHTVHGPSALFHGVLVSGRTGVTIKNLRVSGFNQGAGFLVGFSDEPTLGIVLRNNVAEQDHVGFALDRVTNSTLVGNTSHEHPTNGFAITTSSNDNILRNNAATNNGVRGFILAGTCNDNRLEGNVATANALEGITVANGSARNTLVGKPHRRER